MSKTILITRPKYDPTTRYLSCWSKPVIDQAKKSGCTLVDLVRNRANRREADPTRYVVKTKKYW